MVGMVSLPVKYINQMTCRFDWPMSLGVDLGPRRQTDKIIVKKSSKHIPR